MTRSAGRYLRRNHLGLLALFIALGGTAYAATQLPRNSVGTKQLKKGAVRTADIGKGAVKLAKIDQAAQDALRGQRGATGPQGPAGTFGSVVVRFFEFDVGKEQNSSQRTAKCKSGEVAVGGGAGFQGSPGGGERVVYSGPSTTGEGFLKEGEVPTGWSAVLYNSEGNTKPARIYVVCAK